MSAKIVREGGGYWRVFVNDVEVSKHNQDYKAYQRAIEEKDKDRTAKVLVKPDFEIRIDMPVEYSDGGIEVEAPEISNSGLTFPSAMGFGAKVTGGRGGQIIHVTNLNSSGAGSLQDALNQTGPRTIVFDVAGVIATDGPRHELTVENGDVTIAGQTAAGVGITIDGRLVGKYNYTTNNIIVRHLRIRPPVLDSSMIAGQQWDAVQFSRNSQVLIDHCSIAGGVDENLDLYEGKDVTIQYCMIESALSSNLHDDGINHYYGAIAGPNATRVSFINNIFANVKRRAPAIASGPSETINNIMYNVQAAWQFQNPAKGTHVAVGNYFKDGPDESLVPFFLDAESVGEGLEYFFDGNYVDDTSDFTGYFDVWDDGATHSTTDESALCGFFSGGPCTTYKLESRPTLTGDFYEPATELNAVDAYTHVIENAGAFPRDVLTQSVIDNITQRTGNGGGGYVQPSNLLAGLTTANTPTDSNNDGISDAWSTANGFDPNGPDISQEVMTGGYLAIEVYHEDLSQALIAAENGGTNNTGISTIQFALSAASVGEAQGTYTITIEKNGDPDIEVTATLNTADDTAIAGTNYTALNNVNVVIPVGQTSTTQDVTIIDNATEDGNVSLDVTLTNPVGGTLGANSTLSLNINDNEGTYNPFFSDELKTTALANIAVTNTKYVHLRDRQAGVWDGTTGVSTKQRLFPAAIVPFYLYGSSPASYDYATEVAAELTTLFEADYYFGGPAVIEDAGRQHFWNLLISFMTMEYFIPTFFNSTQRSSIEGNIDTFHDSWHDGYGAGGVGGNGLPREWGAGDSDSDRNIFQLEVQETLAIYYDNKGDTVRRDRCITKRDEIENELQNNLISGKLRNADAPLSFGQLLESTAYAANTSRFLLRWYVMARQRGITIVNDDWPKEHAQWLLQGLLHPDQSGFTSFNDNSDLSRHNPNADYPTNSNGDMIIKSLLTDQRGNALIENAFICGSGTEQAALNFLWENNVYTGGANISHQTTYIPCLFEDVNHVDHVATPADLAALNMPTLWDGGDMGNIAARKDWNTDSPYVYVCKMPAQLVGHNHVQNHIQIFGKNTEVVSHYSADTSSSAKNSASSFMNVECYNASQGESLWIGQNSPRTRHRDLLPVSLGAYNEGGDDGYFIAAQDLKEQHGIKVGTYQQANGAPDFHTAIWMNFWDGMKVEYHHIINDPTDIADINKNLRDYGEDFHNDDQDYYFDLYNNGNQYSSYDREAQKIWRTTALPVVNANGEWEWSEFGQTGKYKTVIKPTSAIEFAIDENDEQVFIDRGPTFDSTRAFHIQTVVGGTLSEHNANISRRPHYYPETAVLSPDHPDLEFFDYVRYVPDSEEGADPDVDSEDLTSSATGDITVVHLEYTGEGTVRDRYIVIFRGFDRNETLDETVSFTGDASVSGRTEVYVVGCQDGQLYDCTESGGTYTITTGSGDAANAGSVYRKQF